MKYSYDGIILQKYCRFGNNISQLVNAIAVAEKYGVKWVSIQRLKYIFMVNPTFSSTTIGNVVVTKNPLKGKSICGKFFYPKDYPDISDVDIASILQEIGANILNFKHKKSFKGIHVHIRSGDIFSRGRPKSNYTQPPLAFYRKAILDLSDSHEADVRVVYEDTQNPCVTGLLSWLKKAKIKHSAISGSIRDDINELATASVIIAGKGTFSQMIAGMVGAKLICFRALSISDKYIKNYTLYTDVDNTYISDHGWRISNMKGPEHYAQLLQIINYPIEKIKKCKK